MNYALSVFLFSNLVTKLHDYEWHNLFKYSRSVTVMFVFSSNTMKMGNGINNSNSSLTLFVNPYKKEGLSWFKKIKTAVFIKRWVQSDENTLRNKVTVQIL